MLESGISMICVGYVTSGMYVMYSTKNLKTILVIGFTLNDGNVSPAIFHAVLFIQAAGKCCKLTSSVSSIRNTTYGV